MVKVVAESPEAVKQATCLNCAARLEYTQSEVKRHDSVNVCGGLDTRKWLNCPRCGNDVAPPSCVNTAGAKSVLTTEQHMALHGTRPDVLARIALANIGYLRNNKQGLAIAEACNKVRECVEELEALAQSGMVSAQTGESKLPPRPTGNNGASTDPESPLVRYGRAALKSAVLLEPMEDGYWTPWHIANGMLRNANESSR